MVYGSDNKLLYMLTPEGTVSRSEGSAGTSYTYSYFKTDHLGSTRVMLSAVDGTLQASQTTDFYPFGLAFEYSNLNKNKYLFSGKELQDGNLGGSMLEWYDFGAQFYDPVLGRWFNVDPAAQVANPYLFCGNAPMMYVDKDGRIFWLIPAIIGAAISAATYTVSVALSPGGFDNWNWGGFFKSIGIGAVSGAVTSGIGKIFGDIGKFGTEVARGFTHGVVQGGFSSLQGGDFLSGFASGTLSTWIGHGAVALGITKSTIGQLGFGALSGGLGSLAMGGDFLQGATTGLMVTALNQLQHRPNTSSGRYSLKFDGRELHVIDTQTGEVVYSTIATSGKGKHMNNPDSQNIQNEGPIPAGEYRYRNSNWNSQSKLRQVYNIVRGNGDWGDYNVPLEVVKNNSTRSGFYLHGGFTKGSAGCIDAGANIGQIYEFTKMQKITNVTVQY